jgi:1-acyl-sn-glycerol-3-phosphate acyltransferase
LALQGGKLKAKFLMKKEFLLLPAPHTSNWDFILGISALFALNVNIKWLGKNSLFIPGYSLVF